jgi:hypothetical protein
MPTLSQDFGKPVQKWREVGHPTDIPEVAEILISEADDGRLRFLRRAQLEAIEPARFRIVQGHLHELAQKAWLRHCPHVVTNGRWRPSSARQRQDADRAGSNGISRWLRTFVT